MGNPFFQFKQFLVRQEKTAMRVTTDACLFGAIISDIKDDARVLDIGAGTGLLSLMLAQRFPNSFIDAIEVNQSAAEEAHANFANSPFSDRLRLIKADFSDWVPEYPYDVIVTNPPFYGSSLPSVAVDRNQAMHAAALTPKALANQLSVISKEGTRIWILLPQFEMGVFDLMAQNRGFKMLKSVLIRQYPDAERVFRQVNCYGLSSDMKSDASQLVQLDIRTRKGGDYSTEFQRLLAPFYLNI